MTQTQEKEPNFMCKFPKVFKLVAVAAILISACKSEPKKAAEPVIEKLQGIVSRQGNALIISDCSSNRFFKLPISTQDSLGAALFAVVSFTTDSLSGERTVRSIERIDVAQQKDCKRSISHIAMLHESGPVVAIDNDNEIKLTIQKDQIEVRLASGEIIPFNYVDAEQVQDKYILKSSTLSSDFQSELRIIVSTFPVDEKHESLHFHCIIELNQKRMEGIYNF